mmetsp:Transcript_47134/g.142713  ORF Transcript_47134/g.142713 Transcript_47134/m.142713 type:complete len:215 (+) Transcript_47134:873-1517(+)
MSNCPASLLAPVISDLHVLISAVPFSSASAVSSSGGKSEICAIISSTFALWLATAFSALLCIDSRLDISDMDVSISSANFSDFFRFLSYSLAALFSAASLLFTLASSLAASLSNVAFLSSMGASDDRAFLNSSFIRFLCSFTSWAFIRCSSNASHALFCSYSVNFFCASFRSSMSSFSLSRRAFSSSIILSFSSMLSTEFPDVSISFSIWMSFM